MSSGVELGKFCSYVYNISHSPFFVNAVKYEISSDQRSVMMILSMIN